MSAQLEMETQDGEVLLELGISLVLTFTVNMSQVKMEKRGSMNIAMTLLSLLFHPVEAF